MPFFSFEGIDGCGKTTQIRLLTEYLQSQDIPYLVVREPGGTQLGELLREYLLHNPLPNVRSQLLLFFAARWELLHNTILPALANKNVWVLADRYIDSTYAYQIAAQGLPFAEFSFLWESILAQAEPITFFLHIDPHLAYTRQKRLNQFEPNDKGEFQTKVAQGYAECAKLWSKRIRIIDASEDKETVHKHLLFSLRKESFLPFSTS